MKLTNKELKNINGGAAVSGSVISGVSGIVGSDVSSLAIFFFTLSSNVNSASPSSWSITLLASASNAVTSLTICITQRTFFVLSKNV